MPWRHRRYRTNGRGTPNGARCLSCGGTAGTHTGGAENMECTLPELAVEIEDPGRPRLRRRRGARRSRAVYRRRRRSSGDAAVHRIDLDALKAQSEVISEVLAGYDKVELRTTDPNRKEKLRLQRALLDGLHQMIVELCSTLDEAGDVMMRRA